MGQPPLCRRHHKGPHQTGANHIHSQNGERKVLRTGEAQYPIIGAEVRTGNADGDGADGPVDRADSESRDFLLLLPDTHFPGALAVAERIVLAGRAENVMINIGVSFFPNRNTTTFGDMLEHARAALSEAAGAGGGKICLFQHQGYLYSPEARVP